jgi:hypothetical protein
VSRGFRPSDQSEQPTGAQLAAFVLDYYSMIPDTNRGWNCIGPDLRLRTRASYDRFWGQFSGAEVESEPTVDGDFVTVRIRLKYRDGKPDPVETDRLGIVARNGELLIDSDAVVHSG